MEEFLSAFGWWFVFVYAVIQTITIVIPPLGALFAQLAAISLLGPLLGVVLIYLVSTPAFCINFYLSRKYGRPLVLRIVGEGGMKKMDEVFLEAGVGTLVILKVLQGGYFDYVSYAAGLSKISWREFLIVNFFGGIPYSILSYLVFRYSNDLFKSVLILQGVTISLIAISIGINRAKLNKKKTP